MSDNLLQNGVPRTVASIPSTPSGENTVAVVVSGGSGPWLLRFWAFVGNQRTYVGAVRFFADRHSRLVAIVAIPGAVRYECEGMAADVNSRESIEIQFEGIESRGGPWGVTPIHGISVDGARSYRVATGVSGTFTITGQVYGWAAETTLAGAGVTVTADPAVLFGPITVPQNGSVRGNAMGLIAPVSTWTFTNVNAWMIEYVPPGLDFDG